MTVDPVRISYLTPTPIAEAERRAEALLLEQTVELPRAAVVDPFVLEEILPRIHRISETPAGGSRLELDVPARLARNPAQLLNVAFGNSSLQPDLVLERLDLPAAVADVFPGPRFGATGIREALGRPSGPLTCTALKPVGLPPEDLADLCEVFAIAGVDVIKDDHGLADHDFCPFERRVRACVAAVDRAADASGRRALYVPNLLGSPSEVCAQLEVCRTAGVGAVMLTPMLLGMPFFHELVSQLRVPVLAHPALAGAQRFAPAALLGTLFRLFGADAVIYPHEGGRFCSSRETCLDIAARLRDPHAWCRPSLPVPAGGMSVERAGDLVEFYGPEVMLLVGGSLYLAGDELLGRTREFVQRVQEAGSED